MSEHTKTADNVTEEPKNVVIVTDAEKTQTKSNVPSVPVGATAQASLSPSQKVVLFSLIAGLLGGVFGSYAFIKYFSSTTLADRKSIVVQENSAVIDVVKRVSPSVVSITSKTLTQGYFGNFQQQEGAGTGIIISADGLILTNKHVVPEGTTTVTVVMADGKQYTDAKVVARDPLNDVAFIRINASGLPVAKLGDSSKVVVGQQVVAIGNALGRFQNSVTSGIISGIGRPVLAGESGSSAASEELSGLFQTDAAINPGNSGGPLVNLDGQVIGVNTAVAGQGSQNIGFAIPINEVSPLLASVKSFGKIIRPYIGVRYVMLSTDIATSNNLKTTQGAWLLGSMSVPSIIAGGPADKAGLKDGDIVTKINGQSVDENHSPQSIIAGKKVGDTIVLTVVRDGKAMIVNVVLQEAPTTTQ